MIPAIEKFPRDQKFLLGDRMQTIAMDVLEALIVATYTRDRRDHLKTANLGIEKLRYLFRLAGDMRYLDEKRYEHAVRLLNDTGRLIGSWIKSHGQAA